ncbi:phospholipase A2 activator protein isoform X2 [Lycorma delicatula]
MEYKLSSVLYGHSMDVRALAVTADGNIVSTSRDKTAKIWKPNGFNSGFTEVQTLKGHSNFVSSVCVLPTTEAYPGGIIITGSNDSNICAFSQDNPLPLFTFKGHTSTVCHLATGTAPGTFLSASWDHTCKVWLLSSPNEPLVTLTGHQMAVWSCLQLSSGFILTASADKTINVYSSDFKPYKSLSGHTDCVRDLAAVNETEFLSCANDATVRKWNVSTGECLDILYGHPNYIYSMCALKGIIVTGGEDRTVMIWNNSKHQVILLPSQSIWAVSILTNGDVVTGSSDGVVRVFSADPQRQADESVIALFNAEVENLNATAQQEIGGVKVSDLPGTEALREPGKSNGQTKLIREGNGAVCYSWSASTQEWSKIGNVLSSVNENSQSEGGKKIYEGKEYDYVFSVDTEDGKPPLKLPYNDGEDPWHAAQNFIQKNNLSQSFLEQVANFIISNSKKPETNDSGVAGASSGFNAQYCDPFTGGARYIPSSDFSNASNVTNGNIKPDLQQSPLQSKLFPQTTYLRFDHGNLKLILEKLEEFNKKSNNGVEGKKLQSIIQLADISSHPSDDDLNTLKQLLHWSPEILFPVLDVLRLAIRNSEVNASLCGGSSGELILKTLKQHLDPTALPANQMLATRTLSNMLLHPTGESLLLDNRQPLLEILTSLLSSSMPNKQLQIALTTILLNLSIVFINKKDYSSQQSIVNLLNKVLPTCSDAEAQLRGLVALGTLLVSSKNLTSSIDSITVDLLHQLALQNDSKDSNKVAICSQQILNLIMK